MIQVVESISADLQGVIRSYLQTAGPESGACGEHDPAWLSVLEQGLGHRPVTLIAQERRDEPENGAARNGHGSRSGLEGGEICGYLPLALVSSRLFGRFLVSLPYLNRAGVVARDREVADRLVARAFELAEGYKVKYLELRHHDQGFVRDPEPFDYCRDEKVRMVLDLPDSEDALWKAVNAKVRNQIRKGDKSDLSIRWGREDVLCDFYDVFAVNMRDLGTPVYPRKLFSKILEHLGDRAEFAVVDCDAQPVAGALLIHDDRVTQVPSASCLRAFNKTNANMWMYHRLLLRTIGRGNILFDFGRSSEGSGTYRFKKQWGARPKPTAWHYHLREGDVQQMRPDNPKNQKRVEQWKKLPVWLTRLVGPSIVRGIP